MADDLDYRPGQLLSSPKYVGWQLAHDRFARANIWRAACADDSQERCAARLRQLAGTGPQMVLKMGEYPPE